MAQHDDATPRDLEEKLRAEEPPLHEADTNPSRPVNVTEILAAEEPPIHDEDTHPTQATDPSEALAAEEPPYSDEDTNPNRATILQDQLRAEEPPVGPEDTHPTLTARTLPRLLGLVMLIGAALLTALAGYIWLDANDSQTDIVNPQTTSIAEAGPTATATLTATPPPTAARVAAAENTTAETETSASSALQPSITPRPTAAADEVAAALDVPIAASADDRAILRGNEPFTIRPGSQRANVITYTVQDKDTLESIAAKFDLTDYFSLVWSNPTNKYNPLRPGVELNIPPVDGVYYEAKGTISIAEIAQELGVDPYSIIDAEYNNLYGSTPDTVLVEGMKVMVPGGEAQRDLFFIAAPSGTGTISGGVVVGSYSLWGCTAEVTGGTMPFGRPLERYTYMQGFRVGGHTGVDIAPGSGTVGDPIYASGGGTVVFAGFADGGYGNVAVIAHGSVFSLYAHMYSRPNVSCGQQVSQGTVLGQVGSSGNSSGPHLHFEVRDADFNLLNPAGFVSF